MDELELLEILSHTEPCERTRVQIQEHGSDRFKNLSSLDHEKGHCVWCATKLQGKKRRWCSETCVRSAQFHCHPQDPSSKIYRLIFKQQWACARCGESYEDIIRKMIRDTYEKMNRIGSYGWQHDGRFRPRTAEDPERKISLHLVGYGTGDRWQTDHIIPIHKGGKGIANENLQTLCVPCHKAKTRDDIHGWV